ncbi:hypothetical protein [Oryzifoliimicrobium ureilyticus]|uniref:hypothetical protein n=1 Tax=Oryzifoliimicrobium ureilyticus TaxID=3113724 RepID=UPI00307682DF
MAVIIPKPISFADSLPISSVKWELKYQQELSGLGTGEFLAADLGEAYFAATVTLDKADHRTMLAIQADFETLDGAINAFYLYDPRAMYPAADPKGVLLGSATPAIGAIGANNKSLTVSGLPAGYVLTKGDFFHFDYGSNPVRRGFYRIVETVAADGNGVAASFEVRPHFRPGVTAGLPIALIKPACKVKLVPGTFDPGTGKGFMTEGLTFQVQQVP